jgi:hypothetical protein
MQQQQTPSENIQVYLRMRPLNNREINEEQAVTAWRIIDQQSITLDQALFNGSGGGRYIVPAGAYASLLAPTSGGSQTKAYTFSKNNLLTFNKTVVSITGRITKKFTREAALEILCLVHWRG